MEHLAPEDVVEDWSDLSTSALAPGARLGRHELLLPIAYGGMARVWAARQHGTRGFSKLVAIKTILPHLAHNPEFERMFLDEARIASGVHHPNVTEIYELGEEGHVLYLAMEWVNGESLVHVVRGLGGRGAQPIEPRLAARVLADACAGVHAAHELTDDGGHALNVVHRDVSPHNILVSLEGTVKVTDFGVARALGQSHQPTHAGQVKGKVGYMAPEIIGGQEFDRRSDIFALGCVLFEATTGTRPFRGTSDPQVMNAVLRGVYEAPRTVVPGYPEALAAIVDRALRPDPADRYATAEAMRVALEEWLARSGPVVTPSQVGSVVRDRLGLVLAKRRDLVRAAMAASQDADPGRSSAPPPVAPRTEADAAPAKLEEDQSHSGVIPTAPEVPPQAGRQPEGHTRREVPPLPGIPRASTPPPPVARPGAPAVRVARAVPAAPTGARYAVAALGGVAVAMLIGGVGLLVWLRVGAPAAEPSAPAATAAIAPPPLAPAAPSAIASAPVVAVASSSPATVDVKSPPPVRPAWIDPPPAPRPQAPKGPDIPANPY